MEKERPDGLLAGLGGQTGLTIAMQLSQDGILEQLRRAAAGFRHARPSRRRRTGSFSRNTMQRIGQPVIPSDVADGFGRPRWTSPKPSAIR